MLSDKILTLSAADRKLTQCLQCLFSISGKEQLVSCNSRVMLFALGVTGFGVCASGDSCCSIHVSTSPHLFVDVIAI